MLLDGGCILSTLSSQAWGAGAAGGDPVVGPRVSDTEMVEGTPRSERPGLASRLPPEEQNLTKCTLETLGPWEVCAVARWVSPGRSPALVLGGPGAGGRGTGRHGDCDVDGLPTLSDLRICQHMWPNASPAWGLHVGPGGVSRLRVSVLGDQLASCGRRSLL